MNRYKCSGITPPQGRSGFKVGVIKGIDVRAGVAVNEGVPGNKVGVKGADNVGSGNDPTFPHAESK